MPSGLILDLGAYMPVMVPWSEVRITLSFFPTLDKVNFQGYRSRSSNIPL